MWRTKRDTMQKKKYPSRRLSLECKRQEKINVFSLLTNSQKGIMLVQLRHFNAGNDTKELHHYLEKRVWNLASRKAHLTQKRRVTKSGK